MSIILGHGDLWIMSDSHFNHKNICRGVTEWRTPEGEVPIKSTRDFPNLDKMNDMLVNNINRVVMPDDDLIHLGDWSFGGFESIQKFWDRINCKNIHLFLGNHDHHVKKDRNGIKGLFKSVDKMEDDFSFGGCRFFLMHYPVESWPNMKTGIIHLHGHTHLSGGKKMDIGIDGHPEFRPYNVRTEIIPLMVKRPVGFALGSLDHHGDNIQNKDK
jgi:calcineurin-like phosphoesterase family protein